MPHIERTAAAVWTGTIGSGTGTIRTPSSVLDESPFSLPGRVATDPTAGETSPEELLAAAHAACFAMALASELGRAKTPPASLFVMARVVVDEVPDGGHRVQSSTIEVESDVPGASTEQIKAAVAAADERCPLSALVRAVGTVTVEVVG